MDLPSSYVSYSSLSSSSPSPQTYSTTQDVSLKGTGDESEDGYEQEVKDTVIKVRVGGYTLETFGTTESDVVRRCLSIVLGMNTSQIFVMRVTVGRDERRRSLLRARIDVFIKIRGKVSEETLRSGVIENQHFKKVLVREGLADVTDVEISMVSGEVTRRKRPPPWFLRRELVVGSGSVLAACALFSMAYMRRYRFFLKKKASMSKPPESAAEDREERNSDLSDAGVAWE